MFVRSCDRRRTNEADKLKVLSAGADDYICKPFGLAELAILIEVVLRRMRPVTSSRIVFDDSRSIQRVGKQHSTIALSS
jgi:DNA-binding response OmpR family regulator